MRELLGCVIVAAIFLACVPNLSAGIITTLYSTGVDDTGAVLPNLSRDSHYQLISMPSGSGVGPGTFVADSTRFPVSGAWMSNDAASKWIAPQADQSTFSNDTGSGVYIYRTIFDLTGYDVSTAHIAGRWSTDNFGQDMLLNGVSLGITHISEPPNTFRYFSDFAITSGFLAGINTLDFVVSNPPIISDQTGLNNPTGLRVEISGTAEPGAVVPEPSTLVVWSSLGALGMVAIWRRRRRTA